MIESADKRGWNSTPEIQSTAGVAWAPDVAHASCTGSNLLERLDFATQQAGDEAETFQQLLSEQLDVRSNPAEPTPDCLSDMETMNFGQDEPLEPERLAHIEQCRWCQSLLVGVIHAGDGFWQELRRRQAEAAARINIAAGI
jgi:hypothetical protein